MVKCVMEIVMKVGGLPSLICCALNQVCLFTWVNEQPGVTTLDTEGEQHESEISLLHLPQKQVIAYWRHKQNKQMSLYNGLYLTRIKSS